MSVKRRRRVIWVLAPDGITPVRRRWREPRCHYCHVLMSKDDPAHHPTMDHMVPKSRGGSNRRANLVPCCASCNQRKGRMTAEEFTAAGL